MGAVSVQNDAGTVHRFCKDLSPQQNGLKSTAPISYLGSLLLQEFPDFELQSLIISLEAPHLL